MGSGRAVLVAACAAAVAACGGGDKETAAPEKKDIPKDIALSSPDIKNGGAIPAELTCDGDGKRPTIVWRGAPGGSVELLLVVNDPDASDGGFTHWTAYNISAAGGSGLAPEGQFPTGVKEGRNSAGKTGWAPPCPPEGDDPHHYEFTMYALPKASALDAGADRAKIDAAVKTAVAYGTFTGTYARKG